MTRFGSFLSQSMTRHSVCSLLVLILVMCGSCTRSTGKRSDVIRIGYQKTGTLNLLRLRGVLESELEKLGLRVEWIGFPTGPPLLEAMNAGAIDFGHTGDSPPILAQAAGVSFVYAACAPPRPHEEAIVVPANSTLRSVADLKGKRVALNKGSNVHYLLSRVLESAQVPYESVDLVFLAPSDARAAFEGGSIDAWAVWDPYLAEAELSADARVLTDGEGLVANREIHLASRRLVSERPEAIRAIVAALGGLDLWAETNQDEVSKIMAAELGLDIEVIRRVISRKGYGIKLIGDEVLSEQQQVADTFLKLGLIPMAINVRDAALPKSFATDEAAIGDEVGATAIDEHK